MLYVHTHLNLHSLWLHYKFPFFCQSQESQRKQNKCLELEPAGIEPLLCT